MADTEEATPGAFIATRVHAAIEQLTRAQDQLDAAIDAGKTGTSNAGSLEEASRSVRAARVSIDEVGHRVDLEAGDQPSLRDCPACHKRIRTAATLCGYCWAKL